MTRGGSAFVHGHGTVSRHRFEVILVSSPARRRLRGLR
ncbi:hypothetical protein ABIA35_008464 [Catenulispora sp. MAP12-49]